MKTRDLSPYDIFVWVIALTIIGFGFYYGLKLLDALIDIVLSTTWSTVCALIVILAAFGYNMWIAIYGDPYDEALSSKYPTSKKEEAVEHADR